MANWKQRQFNERLLDIFIEKLALEPSWVKKHPSCDELRSYGAIADFVLTIVLQTTIN